MDSDMASTAPISQPLQYMIVTTRQTMPAGVSRGTAWTQPANMALGKAKASTLGDRRDRGQS
jgi:hypothetical protein